MIRGKIIAVSGRKIRVMFAEDNVSTPFIDCIKSIDSSDLKIGAEVAVLYNGPVSSAIAIGVIG